MSQTLNLKIKGLFTSFNELSEAPEGALLEADNIDIIQDSIAQPRRGFDREAAGYSSSAHRTDALVEYQDKKISHHGATLGSANTLSYYDAGAWTSLGTYSAISSRRMKFVGANQNLYFTTNAGIYKLDAYNGTPRISGAYKALDIKASASVSSSTWLAGGDTTAYRVIWGYRDENDNLILGAPSQRETYTNSTGSSKAVDLVVTIPSGVTTAWFVQVYRSAAVTGSIPSDEMGLVYEANPTSAEITAKSMTITDIVPDSLRGATIYTAASQEGLANQNEQPPLAEDMALFRDSVFFLNTTSKHRFYLTLISVGSPNGAVVDDTISIGGVTYTAKAAENVASAQFRARVSGSFTFVDADVNTGTDTITETSHPLQNGDAVTFTNSGGALPTGISAATTYYVVSAATNSFKVSATLGGAAVDITAAAGGGTHTLSYGGSAASNITETALSLVRVINQHANSTVYAYYLSGPDDLPGKILLEERAIGGSAFAITASRATSWNPSDIPTSGTAKTSTNDRFVNGVYFTKPGQEATPLVNFLTVGSKNDEILRGISLREGLYIFKESGEVWKISGYYPTFQVDKIEDSVKLIARESCQVLNNQIFCLSDQGIAIVTDSTKVISRPIEQDLLSLVNQNYSLVQSVAFGLSYEADRKYYIFLPSSGSDTFPTQAYVYNIFTNSWVRHTLSATCGLVDLNNNFYLGDGSSNYLLKERKNYSFLDYVDYGFATTIATITGTTITIGSGIDNVEVGDVLFQASDKFALVTAVDLAAQTLTIQTNPGLTVASATILKGIDTRIRWVPITLANPGIQKQLHTATVLFKQDFNGTAELGFSSDLSQAEEMVEIEGRGLGLWGLFAWGEEPWGGASLRRPIRQWIPRAKQRCSQLNVSFNHRWGYASWQLTGISLFGEIGTEKIGR